MAMNTPLSQHSQADNAPSEGMRIGVYVCHCGGNISDIVDVERAVEAASMMPGVALAKHFMFMCSEPGQNLIAEDIAKEKLDRVVIAACAPSLHETTFRRVLTRAGLNPYLYEAVNIREQVSWVSRSDHEGATEKAIRLIAAGVAKAKRSQALQPHRIDANQRVAVVGGGIGGLRCALDLSHNGHEVTLIEKTPFLGGRMAELGRVFPTEEKASDLLKPLLAEVAQDSNITVHTSAEVVGVSGYIGAFKLAVALESKKTAEKHNTSPETIEVSCGMIALATGFRPYEPKAGEYGFGSFPEVITLPQFVRMLDEGGPTGGKISHNGRPIRNVAFIHCVGSRQVEGIHEPGPDGRVNDYCSRQCCTAVLRAANELKRRYPGVNVYDFYQDIRTYGRGHENYYLEASKLGVLFFRWLAEDAPVVEKASGKPVSPLSVRVKDTLTWGREVAAPADLVVLATGMEPSDIAGLVDAMKLARSPDRFLQEVHPKLRPVESAVAGVVMAGCAQGPMDISESSAGASTAATKAVVTLAKGYIELDPYVAEVNTALCTGQALCVEECKPMNAITMVEREIGGVKTMQAEVNAALCNGCGMCAAVCPTGAIQVAGWRIDQFNAMVDAITQDYEQKEAGNE